MMVTFSSASRASFSFTAAMATALSSSSALFLSASSLRDTASTFKKRGSSPSSASSASSPAGGANPPLVLASHAAFDRRFLSRSARHLLKTGPLIGLSGGSALYQSPPGANSRSDDGMYREPLYLHAARRLPAADCLHWSRHASSSVSGARDRFDPLAGDAELVRREYMASGEESPPCNQGQARSIWP